MLDFVVFRCGLSETLRHDGIVEVTGKVTTNMTFHQTESLKIVNSQRIRCHHTLFPWLQFDLSIVVVLLPFVGDDQSNTVQIACTMEQHI